MRSRRGTKRVAQRSGDDHEDRPTVHRSQRNLNQARNQREAQQANAPAHYGRRRPELQPFTSGRTITALVRKHQQSGKKRKQDGQQAIDEEVPESLDEARMEAEEIIEEKEEVTRQINNKSVSLHGDPLHHKEPGTVRLVFENMNKLAPWRSKGWKLEKARAMMKETSGDFYLGAEVGTNWSKMRKGKDLSTLFRTNTEAKTICGYNKHDNIERGQEGGTAIIALDSAATMVSKSGTDSTGLG